VVLMGAGDHGAEQTIVGCGQAVDVGERDLFIAGGGERPPDVEHQAARSRLHFDTAPADLVRPPVDPDPHGTDPSATRRMPTWSPSSSTNASARYHPIGSGRAGVIRIETVVQPGPVVDEARVPQGPERSRAGPHPSSTQGREHPPCRDGTDQPVTGRGVAD